MRLVTRSDFDGLVTAVLLKQVEQIDEIQFVHPKDLQDGAFNVASQDILTNAPYMEGCAMWFDHHLSEYDRVVGKTDFKGACRVAPSASRVVYDYYGGRKTFGDINEMMEAVDKADSAQFSIDEILNPQRWTLLAFVMDPRTGLGRYHDYRIGNYQLMIDLIDFCKNRPIDEILEIPDVKERVLRYFEQEQQFKFAVKRRSEIYGNVIVTDMRDVDPIPCGNRFMVYALWPAQNVSIWIVNGFRNQNCVFACGHSIVNRSCQTNIGALMASSGGGGHFGAGTCQVPHEESEAALRGILAKLHKDDENNIDAPRWQLLKAV